MFLKYKQLMIPNSWWLSSIFCHPFPCMGAVFAWFQVDCDNWTFCRMDFCKQETLLMITDSVVYVKAFKRTVLEVRFWLCLLTILERNIAAICLRPLPAVIFVIDTYHMWKEPRCNSLITWFTKLDLWPVFANFLKSYKSKEHPD